MKTIFKYLAAIFTFPALLIFYTMSCATANVNSISAPLEKSTNSLVMIWKGDTQQPDQARQINITDAIHTHFDALFHSKSPYVGPKNGSVTLVEFFDYQCSHCKDMAPIIATLKKNNPHLKIIHKQLPIVDNTSAYAAKAALAANLQGKYNVLHQEFMQEPDRLSEKKVLVLAHKAGVNTNQLETDIDSEQVDNEILNNFGLAKALTISGTPAFLIANEKDVSENVKDAAIFFIPGGASLKLMQNLINQASPKEDTKPNQSNKQKSNKSQNKAK